MKERSHDLRRPTIAPSALSRLAIVLFATGLALLFVAFISQ
ncbi:MAG TPA: hypothetical protein VM680_19010 [Verrucomicrobiae bacterium]|nr:hypothetical protein [Verrucomicrobiae bacterium]